MWPREVADLDLGEPRAGPRPAAGQEGGGGARVGLAEMRQVGDAGRTDELLEGARYADALVIESTYLDEAADMAKQFSHLTARMGAELAVKAGVKKLILTHLSRRYREKDVLAEAQTVFPNVSVARDFDTFKVKR